MHTKKRVEFLQAFIRRNASKWYNKYGENLSGIRIDKKMKDKKKERYYSIVFNVIQKKTEKKLLKSEIIPKAIKVKFPDGKIVHIKTDVKQTGRFNFHTMISDQVKDMISGERGTLGLFLKDRQENVFALTCYHVAALGLLRRDKFLYDRSLGDPSYDVALGNFTFKLHKGTMNNFIDAAFVSMGSGTMLNNNLPGGGKVDNRQFIGGPITTSAKGKTIFLYLRSRSGSLEKPLVDNSQGLNHLRMHFEDLLTVKNCSLPGDSGGIVVTNSLKALGIILGGDDLYTYIVPYYKIHDFFPLQII